MKKTKFLIIAFTTLIYLPALSMQEDLINSTRALKPYSILCKKKDKTSPYSFALSPQGKFLGVAATDEGDYNERGRNIVQIIDIATQEPLFQFRRKNSIELMIISSDEKKLIIYSGNNRINIINIEGRSELMPSIEIEHVVSLLSNNNGDKFLATTNDGKVILVDLIGKKHTIINLKEINKENNPLLKTPNTTFYTQKRPNIIPQPHYSSFISSSDENFLIIWDSYLNIFNTADGTLVSSKTINPQWETIFFASTNKIIASPGIHQKKGFFLKKKNAYIWIYETENFKKTTSIELNHNSPVNKLALSNNHQFAVTLTKGIEGTKGFVHFWNTQNGQELARVSGFRNPKDVQLVFSHNDQIVAALSPRDKRILVWLIPSFELLAPTNLTNTVFANLLQSFRDHCQKNAQNDSDKISINAENFINFIIDFSKCKDEAHDYIANIIDGVLKKLSNDSQRNLKNITPELELKNDNKS